MSLAAVDAPGPDSLAERLAEEMRRCWERGERLLAEEFLARHPSLLEHPQAAAELIYEEICLRREHGDAGASSEVLRRFPQWSGALRVLLECDRALHAERAPPWFPAVGETLGDFTLIAELGRGSQGCVFLATQLALAGRPVVLKLSPLTSGEHLALAWLQHTHIVPLYSVADFPERRLRVLCLPYFGGATLAALLASLRNLPPARRTGEDLVRALEQAQAAVPLAVQTGGPTRDWLAGADYVRAVCLLGARLADALQYAHERGLLHLDLKPSNVLLAADGQPMLLDFHLARGPVPAGSPAPAWLGGTPAYLAPEQRSAMEAVRQGSRVTQAVDRRSDVYALGLVLYEALAGRLPETGKPQRLRKRNPQVTASLASLVRRCLAERPEDRYPDAAALADDLRRSLADQPLRGVVNRDLGERWRKWRRRSPSALWKLGLFVLAVVVGGAAVFYIGQQLHKARTALEEGRQGLKQGRYVEARGAFLRGLALAEDLPFGGALAGELTAGLRQADRAEVSSEMHTAAERLRILLGAAEDLAKEDAEAAERLCRGFWRRRQQITERLGKDLPPEVERQARADLLDVAVLWSDLRVRLASPEGKVTARRAALRVLTEAEETFGPSAVLCRERYLHAKELGLADVAAAAKERAAQTTPRTAWEHYALGCSYMRSHDLDDAATELERAVELEPQGLWPNFARGRCAYLQRQYRDALVAFTVCIALAPDSAVCYRNRALVHEALGLHEQAQRDHERAQRLGPRPQ
jgi:serine/threonine protein kinase